MPLSGVRVLDLTRLLPGPYCTLLLADLGADVVKVEDPHGGDYARWLPPLVDDYSATFHLLNRNKRSLVLDLKVESGRRAFLRLVETADVVVESFRPGVLDRLGVGYPVLREHNRGVVLCSITGYGQDGPYRDRAGHDLNYVALGGVLSFTGTRDGTLAMPAVQIGDLGGGALMAVVAILAALRHRDRTGEGQHCDVSMLDGVVSWLSLHAARYFSERIPPRPGTTHLNGRHPCYQLYRCRDGWMSVGALEPKFWKQLLAALGLSHLEPYQFAEGEERDRVCAEIEARFLEHTREEWEERLAGRDVCCEPVLDLGEVFRHPQVRHRGMVVPPGEAGPIEQLGFPFSLSATPPRIRRRAPGYGEHTREVLGEVGYDEGDITRLVAEGATR